MTFDGILKVLVPNYVLQFSKNRWPTLLSICLPSQKVAIQINLKILLHTQFTFYVHSQWWMTSEAKYCMVRTGMVLVNINFRKTSWQGLKKQEFWPNTNIRGFTKFEFTVAFSLKFHWYLRTLSLKFQKARTKIEVFLSLPCWLSQLNWIP